MKKNKIKLGDIFMYLSKYGMTEVWVCDRCGTDDRNWVRGYQILYDYDPNLDPDDRIECFFYEDTLFKVGKL